MAQDLYGRDYATVADTAPGSVLRCDGDFECLPANAVLVVGADPAGELYVPCMHGRHMLAGQLSASGDYYVGLYPAEPGTPLPADHAAATLGR